MTRMFRLLGLVAALFASPAAHADQILGPGRVTASGQVILSGGPVLGRISGGKFTSTPDAIEAKGNITCTVAPCLLTGMTGANIAGTTGTTLFVRPAINLSTGTTFYSASSDFSTPQGLELLGSRILLTPSDRVQILPAAGTMARALDVVQSGPASGTIAGPIVLNSFDMSFSSKVTGAYGTPGLAGAGAIQGVSFGLNVGGPNFDAQQAFTVGVGMTHSRNDTSFGDKGALSAGVHSTATTNGLIDAIVGSVVSDNGSSSPQTAAFEADMAILGTGSATNRLGFVAVNAGSKVASVADVAFAATTGGPDATSGGAWKTLIGLYKQNTSSTNNVMQPTGRIFASDHPVTLADIFYGPNITVTGNIINFPGVVLAGNGKLTTSGAVFYAAAPVVTAGQIGFGGSVAAPSNCGNAATKCLVVNDAGTQRYIPMY